MKILMIIPAYNEEMNIVNTVESLKGYDYVVINDCSTDNTAKICEENGFNVINLVHNLGIGGAVQTGYKYAKEHGYDIAIQYDGDGQHDSKYIEDLVKPIVENESDMVIGSRFISKNNGFQSTKLRRFGISIISATIKLLTFKKITDPTSGFRAVNKTIIDIFANDYPTEYPEPVTIIEIFKREFRISEVPVVMKERMYGESSIKSWKNVYYMINVVLSMFIAAIRRYK